MMVFYLSVGFLHKNTFALAAVTLMFVIIIGTLVLAIVTYIKRIVVLFGFLLTSFIVYIILLFVPTLTIVALWREAVAFSAGTVAYSPNITVESEIIILFILIFMLIIGIVPLFLTIIAVLWILAMKSVLYISEFIMRRIAESPGPIFAISTLVGGIAAVMKAF
jgi:hypothetical protein